MSWKQTNPNKGYVFHARNVVLHQIRVYLTYFNGLDPNDTPIQHQILDISQKINNFLFLRSKSKSEYMDFITLGNRIIQAAILLAKQTPVNIKTTLSKHLVDVSTQDQSHLQKFVLNETFEKQNTINTFHMLSNRGKQAVRELTRMKGL